VKANHTLLMTDAQEQQPLKGQELLDEVDRLTEEGLSKRRIMIACGYVVQSKGARRYTKPSEFYDALLEARGIKVGAEQDKFVRPLSFETHVQNNGVLVVGKAYTQRLGLASSTKMKIRLNPADRTIQLVPIDEPEMPADQEA
jgi:hypothetical protein